MKAFVDRRHIAYRPPFTIEEFKTGLVIGVDAGGFNCVRFEHAPGAIGAFDRAFMERAVAALNAQPMSDFIEAEFE